MLKTITTTNQTLGSLLSAGEKVIAENTRKSNLAKSWGKSLHSVLIQNLGTQDIYIEFGAEATVAGWVKIIQNATFNFEDVTLTDCNLIADGANNTDVRILIN